MVSQFKRDEIAFELRHEDDEIRAQKHHARFATKPPSVLYTADQVWGAAVVADRINDGRYHKVPNVVLENDHYVTKNRTNRDLMLDALDTGVSEADQAEGRAVREWHQKNLMLKSLRGNLSDFDRSMMDMVNLDNFDTRADRYALSLVPSQIRACTNGRREESARERSIGGHIGQEGDKVSLEVEVVRSNYSQKWNVWFTTAITGDGKMIFFSYREQLTAGAQLRVQGTVKAHRDDATQLNRVKVS